MSVHCSVGRMQCCMTLAGGRGARAVRTACLRYAHLPSPLPQQLLLHAHAHTHTYMQHKLRQTNSLQLAVFIMKSDTTTHTCITYTYNDHLNM